MLPILNNLKQDACYTVIRLIVGEECFAKILLQLIQLLYGSAYIYFQKKL